MNRLQCRSTALAVALFLGTCGAHAAQRVFVASTGSDANVATGCLITAPCRSFAAAMDQVDFGGEIVALDAAGYGAVTITKSVTITTNPGYYAGIAASTGNAVTIAAPDLAVVLRGLVINGIGADYGINMTSSGFLTVENSVVSNFGLHGINVDAQARVNIVNTVLRGNGKVGMADGISLRSGAVAALSGVRASGNSRAGLVVEDAGAAFSAATVSDSDLSANHYGAVAFSSHPDGGAWIAIARSTLSSNTGTGVYAGSGGGPGAIVAISASTVTGNSKGIWNDGALVESRANNLVGLNQVDVDGPIVNVGGA